MIRLTTGDEFDRLTRAALVCTIFTSSSGRFAQQHSSWWPLVNFSHFCDTRSVVDAASGGLNLFGSKTGQSL